jgi:Caudovirus prohead serine protease
MSEHFERGQRRAEMLDGVREVRRFHADNREVRETSDGILRYRGYASITERAYNIGDPTRNGFTETIARGAFKRSVSENPGVVLVINHGEGGQLPRARTKSGTMTPTEHDRGLAWRPIWIQTILTCEHWYPRPPRSCLGDVVCVPCHQPDVVGESLKATNSERDAPQRRRVLGDVRGVRRDERGRVSRVSDDSGTGPASTGQA